MAVAVAGAAAVLGVELWRFSRGEGAARRGAGRCGGAAAVEDAPSSLRPGARRRGRGVSAAMGACETVGAAAVGAAAGGGAIWVTPTLSLRAYAAACGGGLRPFATLPLAMLPLAPLPPATLPLTTLPLAMLPLAMLIIHSHADHS